MLRTPVLRSLLLLAALSALPSQASGQSLPDWAAPQVDWADLHANRDAEEEAALSEMAAAGPTLPPAPAPVPVDGGLGLLALAGIGYGARKLRGRGAA